MTMKASTRTYWSSSTARTNSASCSLQRSSISTLLPHEALEVVDKVSSSLPISNAARIQGARSWLIADTSKETAHIDLIKKSQNQNLTEEADCWNDQPTFTRATSFSLSLPLRNIPLQKTPPLASQHNQKPNSGFLRKGDMSSRALAESVSEVGSRGGSQQQNNPPLGISASHFPDSSPIVATLRRPPESRRTTQLQLKSRTLSSLFGTICSNQ